MHQSLHKFPNGSKAPLWPRDGRRAQQAQAQSLSVAACEGPATELRQQPAEPQSLSHHGDLPCSLPSPSPSTGLSPLLTAGALQSRAACLPTPSAVTSQRGGRSRGRLCSPRPVFGARAAGPRERERRGGGRGGATPDHTGSAWEESLLVGRVGAVDPAFLAGESGLGERAFLRGSGSIDKEEERIPGPHSVGGPRGPGTCGRNSRAAHRRGGG